VAKQVVVTMVDDYDGKSTADETVEFSIDGVSYEMDLSVLNASKLRGLIEPWQVKARKVGGRRQQKGAAKTGPATDRQQTAAIRIWAEANGHQVSTRGRISADVIQAYNAAKN